VRLLSPTATSAHCRRGRADQVPLIGVVNKPAPGVVNKAVPGVVNKPVPGVVNKPVTGVVNKPVPGVVSRPVIEVVNKPVLVVVNKPVLVVPAAAGVERPVAWVQEGSAEALTAVSAALTERRTLVSARGEGQGRLRQAVAVLQLAEAPRQEPLLAAVPRAVAGRRRAPRCTGPRPQPAMVG
jgi:hypothetical protein